ncbi:glutathione-dependent formaldehyde-activating [Pochonia chlamydosporia 170]|uniref:Glutathione-dependent formaldehyde-activating n=1 Tax=Pochonia chlamydosporia 170 TaxID=1380566 RepID=A0A179G634_METCM|nr:glutathione-dependent formaldehyde-activating [Pochonia chlamydosporia 170]OAQ72811.1 glutathione-dependent formaldehyde-activating [Pochonia chlamydosporia 170]
MPHYSEKDIFPMQGGCPCGHIRYQINQPPLLVHCCHCTSCQRELGSAFAINAIIERDELKLLPSAKPTIPGSKGAPGGAFASFNETFARLTLSDTRCGPVTAKSDAVTEPTESKPEDTKDKPDPKVELITFPTESTIGITIAQCPVCHTGLWTHYADAGPHTIYLRGGTLDAAHEIDPDVHIFTRSKRDFVTLGDDKPQFEWYYKDRNEFIREDCKARYAKLKEKSGDYMVELRAALGK